ncbi:reverse transcriptase domain-containing protein [Escherichia coli]|nr:reverse transcriptase domain-containing protein [Escherichia coli]
MLRDLNHGLWRLSPLQLVRRADGERVAVWGAEDAVVLTALTYALTPLLPVSPLCSHVAGNGGKTALQNTIRNVRNAGFRFVCRLDIRQYYASIRRDILMAQLRQYVTHPVHLSLLSQFHDYTVEDGGTFHTPSRGISRGCALSPLLAAFHLREIDDHFARCRRVRYVRYMDDFLLLTRTRWHLRHAVRELKQFFSQYGFTEHPDKTFTGPVKKGTDWMGYQLTERGLNGPAPRAVNNMLQKLHRLYEQARRRRENPASRVAAYLQRWCLWASLASGLAENRPSLRHPFRNPDCPAVMIKDHEHRRHIGS